MVVGDSCGPCLRVKTVGERGTQSLDPSARPHLRFQNYHIMTSTIEFVCGREPGQSRAHDNHPFARSLSTQLRGLAG